MIATIFGKKGSGKTTLTKEFMLKLGGRVVFLSPVTTIKNIRYTEVWSIPELAKNMAVQKVGDVILCRIADVDALDLVCAYAISDGGGYTVIVDEIDLYKDSSELLHAIHYSRHFNINLVCNTRRYADVPRLLTSQSDLLCFFKTNEPQDVKYLREYTSKEFSEICSNLAPFHYITFPDNQILSTTIKNI